MREIPAWRYSHITARVLQVIGSVMSSLLRTTPGDKPTAHLALRCAPELEGRTLGGITTRGRVVELVGAACLL